MIANPRLLGPANLSNCNAHGVSQSAPRKALWSLDPCPQTHHWLDPASPMSRESWHRDFLIGKTQALCRSLSCSSPPSILLQSSPVQTTPPPTRTRTKQHLSWTTMNYETICHDFSMNGPSETSDRYRIGGHSGRY